MKDADCGRAETSGQDGSRWQVCRLRLRARAASQAARARSRKRRRFRSDGLLDDLAQLGQAGGDVLAQVHAQDAAAALRQYLEVALRLRRLEHAEAELLGGDR